MAATLQHLLNDAAPAYLAQRLRAVWPRFAARAFVAEALAGYAELPLMARGQRLADGLQRHLPPDVPEALALLVAAMEPPQPLDAVGEPASDGRPHSGFLYLPHSLYIARHGPAHADAALDAMHALTQRFTAEFCLRPCLQQQRAATLARLAQWAGDPSAHVRRLVSEGTRPRLPWAPRLPDFQRDPAPVLPLLQRLRDDPSAYVRRSVANHLNDIGKDHPALLVATARDWWAGAGPERQRLLRHALRSAVKRGDTDALAVLGLGHEAALAVHGVRIAPESPRIGGAVDIALTLHNPGPAACTALADLRVGYAKADGRVRPRVFKLQTVTLAPGASHTLVKRLSLVQMSTRTHHPGEHPVELLLNGRAQPLGAFTLRAAP